MDQQNCPHDYLPACRLKDSVLEVFLYYAVPLCFKIYVIMPERSTYYAWQKEQIQHNKTLRVSLLLIVS